jgi:hypothetical protein
MCYLPTPDLPSVRQKLRVVSPSFTICPVLRVVQVPQLSLSQLTDRDAQGNFLLWDDLNPELLACFREGI